MDALSTNIYIYIYISTNPRKIYKWVNYKVDL